MALQDRYDFDDLKNESENFVFKELEQQLNEYPQTICLCNDCVGDMVAVALNSVKPMYRWSLLGRIYTASAAEDEAYSTQIRIAVRDAIEKIRKNPSHDM
jgi:competence protein ComFB